jgi:hypothetical protein
MTVRIKKGGTTEKQNATGDNRSLEAFRTVEADVWIFEELSPKQRACGMWVKNHGLPLVLEEFYNGEWISVKHVNVCPLCGSRRVN